MRVLTRARTPFVETLPELDLACAVGVVTARSVRFWLRAPGVCEVGLTVTGPDGAVHALLPIAARPEADHTAIITYPDDCPDHPPLRPGTRHEFELRAGDRRLGAGAFTTAPASAADMPERLCFAVTSCHQPFDEGGHPSPVALAMLRAANRALNEHDVRFVVLGGDQIYADEPPCFSIHGPKKRESVLLGKSRQEIRRLYHGLYRRSWAVPGFLELGHGRATHCMLDDHEIVDNWGSDPAHGDGAWQDIAAGALDAFYDYQCSRTFGVAGQRPPRLWRSFAYGTIAVFIADVRSERSVAPGREQVLGHDQIEGLAAFLRDNRDKHALFVAIGVPLVHIPGWLNAFGDRVLHDGSDLHDRWSSGCNIGERDRLLSLLARHQVANPHQRLALLSGDIHAGWVAGLAPASGPPFYQFVASALTNRSRSMTGTFARALLEATRPLEHEVGGLRVTGMSGQPGNSNPYGGLNLGIIEVARTGPDRSTVRFKLIGQAPKQPEEPLVVFDSGPLG